MQKKQTFIKALIETLVITLLYLTLGYLFFPSDPLILEAKIPIIPIVLTIITLYHGAKLGFISLSLMSIVLFIVYHPFPLYLLLSYLVLLLILGQFYHYWSRKLESLEATSHYTKTRLDEMQHAFYTLKISHDILEKSYALKPKSIRSAFKELSALSQKDSAAYRDFFHIIHDAYHVEKALISLYKKGKWQTIDMESGEKKKKFHSKDPLVQEALESEETAYISASTEQESHYLAVIPYKDEEDNITALLAVEKMPFLDFNQDTIISLAILFTYFIHQRKLVEYLKVKGDTALTSAQRFTYNYEKLYELHQRFSTPSATIVFKCKDDLSLHKLGDFLSHSLRALDQFQVQKEYPHTALLLLPLTTTDAAKAIVQKVNQTRQAGDIDAMIFEVDQKSQMLQYIKEN